MRNSNQLLFNSISELMGALDSAPVIHDREDYSDERDSGSDWCDTTSYKEAHDLIIAGKMYDGLSGNLNKYKTPGSKEKNKTYNDVVGYNVVVPLYLQNVPTCMVNKRKTINNKIVTILYDCAAPGSVSQNQLIKTATELMRNIIKLEKDGYRVNLYVMCYCNSSISSDHFGFILKLKNDRETLNIKKLCFPLISSSFLRRIDFRVKERLYKDWIGHGYGLANSTEEELKTFIYNMLKIKRYELWNYKGKKFTNQ